MSLAVTEKFKNLIATKGILYALQQICPIEVNFKILAKQVYRGKKHDISILFAIEGKSPLLNVEPADVQVLITQLLTERGSNAKIEMDKVKYDGKIYVAVFIDR